MAGYWLKLYTEILDDPKYFRLSDNAKLGMIELMLVAKRANKDGEIPSIEDVAFFTRRSVEWWTPVFEELAKIEYLVINGSETIIRKFAERQAAVADSERMKQSRIATHKKESVTNRNINFNKPVTKRNGDSDTETDSDSYADSDSDSKPTRFSRKIEPPSVDQAWNTVKGQLADDMNPADYRSWIENVKPCEFQGDTFKISTVNKYAADWITKRAGEVIKRSLAGIYGRPVSLNVIVDANHIQH